jgi:class 3 adenylate cyclase/predicted ATPase
VDVGAWLRELGLEQYEQAFQDNDINDRVLPGLSAEDLREIGVTSVGHRRLLLQAVAALRELTAPAIGPATDPVTAAPSRAERRQLTVMFVDLVGSTALSARLDPEEMGKVIRSYQNAVAGEILRFGGHVAKYMGDGVLAYFGWPVAHEDAAERAVRAGLAIIEAVAVLVPLPGLALQVRIGIATGLVVVGDLIGEGAAREEAVVGETPNLAARLQALADPNSVVIAPGTHRLVRGLFELQDLGTHTLKGLAHPVQAWSVAGTSLAESRFEAQHITGGLTPLVGREQELALLLDRWQQAKEGEGQVVLLSGEAGVGKSRLLGSLRERLKSEPYMPLSHYCSPFHQTSALHPMIGLLERAAGLARDDPPERRLDKLEALLARGCDHLSQAAPLLAALLTIPTGSRYLPLALSPQRQKERTLAALLDQLAGLAAKQPVLAVYEDLHWSDPTTLELLDLAIERVQRLPVLVLLTFRPEFSPPWRGRPHMTALTLNRLSRKRGAALVAELTGGKALPPEVLEQIVTRTDGVPLFVEELTKTVLESDLLRDAGDHYELVGPLPPLAIPSTLHDSLMARLDRIAPVKEVAQVGAVIGRYFSHELLAAVAPLKDNALKDALDQLVQAELIFRRGTSPEMVYSFKHALVRDAAYQSLLKSRRQQLHARIASVMEERFPEVADTEPELLAIHLTEAELPHQAASWWLKAGQRALARSATAEGIAHLTRGLETLEQLPEESTRDEQELALQLALGPALIGAKGFAAPETGRAYARAYELCLQSETTPQLLPALFGQFVVYFQRGELGAAYDAAKELLRHAEERRDVAAEVAGCRAMGAASFQLGRLVESRSHLDRGLALYDPERDRVSGAVYGIDSRVVSLHWLSQALLTLGHPDQGLARAEEAVAWADELAHHGSMAHALCGVCFTYQRLGRPHEAQAYAEPLIRLAKEQGFPLWGAAGRIIRGWTLAEAGQTEESLKEIRLGLAEYTATGAQLWLPDFLALQAEAHVRAGQAEAALQVVASVLHWVGRDGGRWIEPELHRLRGELLLAQPEADAGEALAFFQRAITIACGNGAKMLELRAATSLARLWRDQGRGAAAHDLLTPIYDWFSEGFDAADLQSAKALLDGLR